MLNEHDSFLQKSDLMMLHEHHLFQGHQINAIKLKYEKSHSVFNAFPILKSTVFYVDFCNVDFAMLTFAMLTFAISTFAMLTFAILTFAILTFAILTFRISYFINLDKNLDF